MVNTMVSISPSQEPALTGITSYSTESEPDVVFSNVSFAMALDACPAPGRATTPSGFRPAAVRIFTILKFAATTEVPFVTSVIPEGRSLQTVAFRFGSSTGSGSTVKVIVSISPRHPPGLTGTTSYSTLNDTAEVFVKISPDIAFGDFPLPAVAFPEVGESPPGTRISKIL